MIVEIQSKYLVFPVNTYATSKKLTFQKAGDPVYQLDMKLDNCNPNFYAYIDVSRFSGQTLELSVAPEMALIYREANDIDIPNPYAEPMRPKIHFSPKNGWINDPNGLIYWDGVYHMFFQHNPADPDWGNMHWGHAESPDLIHWEEKNIALFPDKRGMMYSGSAIVDTHNLLGKNMGSQKAALLFYTTTTPYCQNISYSLDNFQTIHPYEGNPVVPHIEASNRDPNVSFCEELDCYIMALFLTGDEYCILKSNNLKTWKELQRIQLPGDSECPDLFPICDQDGNRKWIFMGAGDRYLVGTFRCGKFAADQPAQTLRHSIYGYAGQTFRNLPDGRIVRVVWDNGGPPYEKFTCQMGMPTELSLHAHKGLYYLQAAPVAEIQRIYKSTKTFPNVSLTPEKPFKEDLENTALLIKLKGETIHRGKMNLTVFGRSICFDFDDNKMSIGDNSAPISLTGSGLELTLVVDRWSMEFFADSGKIFLTCLGEHATCDYNLPYVTIQADTSLALESIELHSLSSIWKK